MSFEYAATVESKRGVISNFLYQVASVASVTYGVHENKGLPVPPHHTTDPVVLRGYFPECKGFLNKFHLLFRHSHDIGDEWVQ
jgi:hypothetical protein